MTVTLRLVRLSSEDLILSSLDVGHSFGEKQSDRCGLSEMKLLFMRFRMSPFGAPRTVSTEMTT